MTQQTSTWWQRKPVIWLFCLFHGLLMLFCSLYLLSLNRTSFDEAQLIRWSFIFKQSLFNKTLLNKKPPKENFFFIDVSQDKQLLEVNDGLGNIALTDRTKLGELFELLSRYPDVYDFVLCDIIFDLKSPQDSLISASLARMPKKKTLLSAVILPDSSGQLQFVRPIFDAPSALAVYRNAKNGFFKYRLKIDSLKLLPSIMYENLDGGKVEEKNGFFYTDNQLSLNATVLDFMVLSRDIGASTGGYPKATLGELLFGRLAEDSDSAFVHNYFKDKILVIADLGGEIDTHSTAAGSQPGVLIMINAYLSLLNKTNVISWLWLLFLLFSFTGVSYVGFVGVEFKRPLWLAKMQKGSLGSTLDRIVGVPVMLVLITLLSYFIFGLHLSILLFAIYFAVVARLIRTIKKRMQKQEQDVLENQDTTAQNPE